MRMTQIQERRKAKDRRKDARRNDEKEKRRKMRKTLHKRETEERMGRALAR